MAERRGRIRGRMAAALIGVGLVAGVISIASPSQASFPGTNGLIAYVDLSVGGNVFVVNPSNPVPTQVTNTGNFTSVAFNAAANKLAASTTAGLVLLDPVAGSTVTPIPNTTGTDTSPSFNPTGDKVAFSVGTGIATISTSGADRTVIATAPTNARSPEWAPDGSFIAFAEDNLLPTNEIVRIAPTGGARVVLSPAAACAAACHAPTVSPDSKKVAFESIGTSGIVQVNADGTSAAAQRLTSVATDNTPSYSPDGAQVAFLRGNAPGALSRAPTDGSGTATAVGTITATTTLFTRVVSWGTAAGTGTGTGTGTGIGGSVISVAAVRNGAQCVFNITATPPADGITVDFSITNRKGTKEKLAGNDVTVPASPSVKARKRGKNKVRTITLSDPKGATLGTSTATCAKK